MATRLYAPNPTALLPSAQVAVNPPPQSTFGAVALASAIDSLGNIAREFKNVQDLKAQYKGFSDYFKESGHQDIANLLDYQSESLAPNFLEDPKVVEKRRSDLLNGVLAFAKVDKQIAAEQRRRELYNQDRARSAELAQIRMRLDKEQSLYNNWEVAQDRLRSQNLNNAMKMASETGRSVDIPPKPKNPYEESYRKAREDYERALSSYQTALSSGPSVTTLPTDDVPDMGTPIGSIDPIPTISPEEPPVDVLPSGGNFVDLPSTPSPADTSLFPPSTPTPSTEPIPEEETPSTGEFPVLTPGDEFKPTPITPQDQEELNSAPTQVITPKVTVPIPTEAEIKVAQIAAREGNPVHSVALQARQEAALKEAREKEEGLRRVLAERNRFYEAISLNSDPAKFQQMIPKVEKKIDEAIRDINETPWDVQDDLNTTSKSRINHIVNEVGRFIQTASWDNRTSTGSRFPDSVELGRYQIGDVGEYTVYQRKSNGELFYVKDDSGEPVIIPIPRSSVQNGVIKKVSGPGGAGRSALEPPNIDPLDTEEESPLSLDEILKYGAKAIR